MAGNDGSLNFDTKIDSSGFQKGLDTIGGAAQKGLSITSKILGGAAAAVTALGGAAIKVGSDFEAGMSQVQAITGTIADEALPGIIEKAAEMGLSFEEGANATETAMNILSAKAKEMGASTKFSATESAEAMNYMAMAGWKTEDMLGGIEGIMNLAAASGEDLAITSDIVTDALTAFGMSASDSTHFADILAAASSNANTNVGLMGETFKYVAPLAGALKYSAEDTAMAIGLMANAGIKGTQAGTALRSIMTRMSKPTKESAMAMEALGLSITDSSGKMKPFSEVISDMRNGFSGLTEDEQASYAAMLGGQEAMSGLLAIVNASDADFEKLSGAINDCNGSAAEMAEIMQDNLQGQITILQSGLEGLGVSLYETMQDTAKDVVKEAQGMVQQLQDAFNEGGFQGLVGAFGNVLAQIVQRIAEAAPTVIEAAVSLVMSFCDGLKSAPGIGESGASLITSLVTGLMSCVGEIWTTAIVLIGKLAEGIAAGAPQMIQAASRAVLDVVECIVDWMPDILQAGADIVVALAGGIAGAIPTLIYQAFIIILEFAEALVENLPVFVDAALQLVTGLVQGLIEGIPLLLDGAIQLFMSIQEALPVIIEQLLQELPGLITAILDFFTENVPLIVDGSITLLMGLIEAFPVIIQAVTENFPQIITALVDGLTTAWPQVLDGAITLLMAIISAIPDIVVAIGENFPLIIEAVGTALADAVPKVFEAAKNLLGQIIEAVPDIVAGLAEVVPDIVAGLVNGLVGGLGAVKDAALELGSGILDGVKSFFGIHSPSTVMAEQGDYLVQGLINGIGAMPAELSQHLNESVASISAWGQQMLSSMRNAVQGSVNEAVMIMSALPGKLWTWLVGTITRITAWDQQMRSNAKAAISNMIAAIISLLSQLPGKVSAELAKVTAGMVKWGADIVNRMTEVGRNIVSGIWNGISSGWDWLKDQVAGLAESLLDSAKDALGIHSPSTAFRDELGRWLMPGTMEGVKRSMPKALQEMKAQAGELLAAMQGTVSASMNRISLNASGAAGMRALTTAGTTVYNDNRMEQENNYHVPVVSPAETAKANREAFRKMAGGVK